MKSISERHNMDRLLAVKKPPVRSHDYRLRSSDKKRRIADGNTVRYAVEMTEDDLDTLWKRLRAEDKAKALNDWFKGGL